MIAIAGSSEKRSIIIEMARIKYKDPDWLEHHYHDLGKTMAEMASECGIAHRTIAYHMDKNNIESRSSGQELADKRLNDPEWCREQYIEKGLSFRQIARDSESAYPTVRSRMLEHGITPRDAGGSEPIYDVLRDGEWLREKYVKNNMTITEMSDEVGCDPATVFNALKRKGIETLRKDMPSGENHPNWRGGYSEYYGPSWNRQREKALERAGYECEHTGMTQEQHIEEYGMGLHVHHIIPFRKFGVENHKEANKLENLRVLSCSQHNSWERMPVIPMVVE